MTRLSVDEQCHLDWFKAAASVPSMNCVEVAKHPDGVAIRHSARPEDEALVFSRSEFGAFVDGARRGEFDELFSVPAPREASAES